MFSILAYLSASILKFSFAPSSMGAFTFLNIIVTRNRKSINFGIRVTVPGNHLFVFDYSFCFHGNICQGLAASAVRSSLYKYTCRNYDSVCTKVNLKSGFHITGQLMETHPEYSFSTHDWSNPWLAYTYNAVLYLINLVIIHVLLLFIKFEDGKNNTICFVKPVNNFFQLFSGFIQDRYILRISDIY